MTLGGPSQTEVQVHDSSYIINEDEMKSDSEDEDEDGNESYPEASASGNANANAKMDLKGGWERVRDNDGNRNEDGDGRMVGLEETLGQTDEGNPSMAHWQLDSMSDNGGGVSVVLYPLRRGGRQEERLRVRCLCQAVKMK